MSTLYGVYASDRLEDVPSTKVPSKYERGKLRVLHDEITLDAELGVGDIIKLFEIPKGAVLLDLEVNAPADGTSGIVNIGWLGGDLGEEAADPDGIAAALDFTAANARTKMANSVAGFQKEFSEKVQVQAVVTEASDALSGQTIKFTAIISEN